MTITRMVNGHETQFELTPHELCAAYFEQQRQFDEEDIWYAIDGDTDEEIMDCFGITAKEFNDLLPQFAHRYRKYLDNDDGWSDLRGMAIRDEIWFQKESGILRAKGETA